MLRLLRSKNLFETICKLAILSTVVSILLLSWVPPVSRDALTHHLAVPKLYLKHGGMHEIKDLDFSYYPMNLDLLYMIPLWLGNDIAPKMIHFTFAFFTMVLIYSYLRSRLNQTYALIGALFFLSLPVVVKLSITVYVDLGLVFFSTVAIFFLLKWKENTARISYLIACGVFCGLALGTKYNGLITFFILTLIIPIASIHDRGNDNFAQVRAVGHGFIFALVALIVFSPWMIRNYLWTANPLYPLFDGWFNPAAKQASTAAWNHFDVRRWVYGESWWEIMMIPLRIFFQGQDGDPRYFDGRLNPLLILLLPLAFLSFSKNSPAIRREKWILLVFSILFLFFVFFQTDMRVRWIAPIIPPMIILMVFGLRECVCIAHSFHSMILKRVAFFIIFFVVAAFGGMNVVYLGQQFDKVQPFQYLTGEIGRDRYIQKHRPEYAVIRFGNDHLPKESKIYCLFLGSRRYYSDNDLLFDNDMFVQAVKDTATAAEMTSFFKNKGIPYLMVGRNLFDQWADAVFDSAQKVKIQTFFREMVTSLYEEGGYSLYAIKRVANDG